MSKFKIIKQEKKSRVKFFIFLLTNIFRLERSKEEMLIPTDYNRQLSEKY